MSKPFNPNRNIQQGYTLTQLLIVLFIILVLVGISIPNVMDYYTRTKGMACANNLRNIQAAKDSWVSDYPETPTIPSDAELVYYLKSPIPACPQGGNYTNTRNCELQAECHLNGNASYEPSKALPLGANGYHDLKLPK